MIVSSEQVDADRVGSKAHSVLPVRSLRIPRFLSSPRSRSGRSRSSCRRRYTDTSRLYSPVPPPHEFIRKFVVDLNTQVS